MAGYILKLQETIQFRFARFRIDSFVSGPISKWIAGIKNSLLKATLLFLLDYMTLELCKNIDYSGDEKDSNAFFNIRSIS